MAECDRQHIGHVRAGTDEQTPRAKQDIGSHVCADEQSTPAEQTVDAHVCADEEPTRATQSIPPALRREVLRRDGGRCRVPGCRHATFVDVHHIERCSEGGKHSRENLVTLCSAHHAALHAGKLLLEGTPYGGLTFFHADGTAYGQPVSVSGVDVRAKAYSALVELGFRESETKRALARVPLFPDLTLEGLVRQTLSELAPDRP